jgi:luciferase family oxidoreductase group 1
MKQIRLSVLDQSPVRRGSNAKEALQESVQLVRLADELGYTRYWLSEHHNTTMLAGSAPEVLIARLASEGSHIRLGSGGIMLPNHSTLKVAENFRLLEALYPQRIDLGIGRAPGGDRITSQLLNPSNSFDPQEYIRQVADLQAFLTDTPTEGTINGKVRAIPVTDTAPDLWMLTSSGESAYLAAFFGIALCFAKFINPVGAAEAIQQYKERFKPSAALAAPQTCVAIFGFCAESEQKVKEAQAMMDFRFLSFEKGHYDLQFSYNDIKDYDYSPAEWQRVLHNRGRVITGTPDVVKEKLVALAEECDTDEIMIATFTEHFEDRLQSYKLLADMFELKKAEEVTSEAV